MKNPCGGDYTWSQLQYVFPLVDPNSFSPAPVAFTAEERDKLVRFSAVSKQLAGTSLLGAADSFTISISDDGAEEQIETSFSAPDVTTGFMVFLRQCYANGEEASFVKVRGIIMKALAAAGDAESAGVVKEWSQAHSKLTNTALGELAQEKMVDDGIIPRAAPGPDGKATSFVVRGPAPPEELLRTYWYGEQIHWGDYRHALGLVRSDEFDAARWDLAVRQVAVDFAYFYGGFAVLIDQTLTHASAS